MRLRKRKRVPDLKKCFLALCPESEKKELFQIIAYNYRAEGSGFVKVKGIIGIDREKITVFEDEKLLHRYSTSDFDGAYFLADGASARIILKVRDERVLLATADLSQTEQFAATAQALDRFLTEGVYLKPAAIKENCCPKCGQPYRPGSNTCMRCSSKKQQIKWLFEIIKPLIPWLLLSILLYGITSLVGLISPQLSELMVDGYLKNNDAGASDVVPYLLVVLAMLLCTVASRLLSALRSYLSARIGVRATLDLRNSVFEKVQSLSLAGVHRRTAGELMQRISNDTAVIKDFLTGTLGSIVEQFATILTISAILIYYDITKGTSLFLPVILPVIPALILYRLFHNKVHRMYHSQWQVNSKASSILHDIFSGIRVVKAFGREEAEIAHYDSAIRSTREVQRRNETFWAIFSPAINFLMCMGEFFILFAVGNKILGGEMTLGEMTKLTAYASMIYGPLRAMSMLPRRITHALTSLSKIYDLMEDPDAMGEEEDTIEPEISGKVTFEDVSFGYETGRQVLRHIDLEIKPGEMIGLVGRSGVGKSTLTNLIMRLYRPEEGIIRIDDYDLSTLSSECLRKNVGSVLQETFLFSGTIRDNIAYAKPQATGEEIIAAAKIAGAHNFIMKLPDGYDTVVGEKGNTLSGGEKQRIAIARAVLLDPKILILDEATSALDTETEKQIQEALAKLIEGRTTIAIAHRLSTLRNATRIIVLDDHSIVETGTHEELMKNENGIYYRLVMAQRMMSSKKNIE